MMCNVRTDVRQMQPIVESVEKIKAELEGLKREFGRLDDVAKSPDECPSCGKGLLPWFRLSPSVAKT